MSASKALRYEVLTPTGERTAATVYVEEAAMLVAVLGYGYSIRYGKLIVWREGKEEQSANESYDHVADVAHTRIEAFNERVGT